MLFPLLSFFCLSGLAQNGELNIIPQPKSAIIRKGTFKLNYKTKIVISDRKALESAAFLNDYFLENHGYKLEFVFNPRKTPPNAIIFEYGLATKQVLSDEGYVLTVSSKEIRLKARGNAGMFYALQTFFQLLPANIEKGNAIVPAVEIVDEPRFSYRGMHLDVGRHFMPVSFVKKYIDLMAQYKFNQFHWHLTEDQGWRIEIKKYPRLTEIGSKRPQTHEGRYSPVFKGDGIPVEGFYTQEQIREVVAYAKRKHINIIPEIELPGHSSAALAAYPEFGCKENYEYKVQQTWGIFKEVFCPYEKTFQFLEDVLSEVIELFPYSPYIHIGGDEVLKDHWKESEFVQELKKRENLKDEHEVQSYFIRRIGKFLNSKGKILIGWDEILEGGLASNAVVMSWRGERGGIAAAKMKHNVIMTPTDFMYFDYGQGDPKFEPLNIGGYVPLEKVYSYNPHPKELPEDEKKYVLGAQANVWTEYMKTPEKVEYMVFPRMLALSEVVWSPLEVKNFTDFQRRLSAHFPRLDKQNVKYRIPEPVGLQNILLTGGQDSVEINLKSLVPNSKIFYTTDGSEPNEESKLYSAPLNLKLESNQKINLRVIVVNRDGRRSVPYAATIWRREWQQPVENFQSTDNGMNFTLFKGEFKSVADFSRLVPIKTGKTQNFFRDLGERENFGVFWEGYLSIPKDEIYEFWLESKGGAVLQIGEETVVDLDGIHERKTASGEIPLKAGFYRVRLKYFQTTGEPTLSVRFGIKHQPLRSLENSLFF